MQASLAPVVEPRCAVGLRGVRPCAIPCSPASSATSATSAFTGWAPTPIACSTPISIATGGRRLRGVGDVLSAKSFAAHLTGLCWIIERGRDRAIGSEHLRRWLDRAPEIERPPAPTYRGQLTILDLEQEDDPEHYARAVERWAESTWEAYAALHSLARLWIEQALARG